MDLLEEGGDVQDWGTLPADCRAQAWGRPRDSLGQSSSPYPPVAVAPAPSTLSPLTFQGHARPMPSELGEDGWTAGEWASWGSGRAEGGPGRGRGAFLLHDYSLVPSRLSFVNIYKRSELETPDPPLPVLPAGQGDVVPLCPPPSCPAPSPAQLAVPRAPSKPKCGPLDGVRFGCRCGTPRGRLRTWPPPPCGPPGPVPSSDC